MNENETVKLNEKVIEKKEFEETKERLEKLPGITVVETGKDTFKTRLHD